MTDAPNSTVSTTDALKAMRDHGIDDAESLVSCTTADRIVKTCEYADREGWNKRLLVWKIKQGGVDIEVGPSAGSKRAQLRDRFDAVAERFGPGEVTESHRRLARRCWPQDQEDCQGVMVVWSNDWPSLNVVCDGCGFEASYPARALGVLPASPPVPARPIP